MIVKYKGLQRGSVEYCCNLEIGAICEVMDVSFFGRKVMIFDAYPINGKGYYQYADARDFEIIAGG